MLDPSTTESGARGPTRLSLSLAALAMLVLASLVFVRLSAYGIWDPWELSVADAARKLGETKGDGQPAHLFVLKLISGAFSAVGTREWAGRLPIALSGILTLLFGFLWALRFANARAATLSVLVLGTTPLFLLHSRQMLGGTPTFLAATLVMLGASGACLTGARKGHGTTTRSVFLLIMLVGAGMGLFSGGALLTSLPALGAVALTFLFLHGLGEDLEPSQRTVGLLCVALGLSLTAIVAHAVWQHAAEASVWIGGAPLDDAPPTFERVIEHVFHGFAPWSALLPVALGSLLTIDDVRSERSALKLSIMLWAILSYAAQTLFLSSYGSAPFPAPVALAVAVGLWLDDVSRTKRTYWPETLISLLLVGLLIRDFALYPASPLGSLELSAVKLPDTFNPKKAWIAVLSAFALGLGLFAIATPDRSRLELKAPYRGLRTAWQKSPSHKLWLVVLALSAVGMLVYGAVAALGVVRVSTIARRVGMGLGGFVIIAPIAIAVGQLVYHLSRFLAPLRVAPMIVGAFAVGAYTSQWFLPQVSEQFSPRGVFDAYNKLGQPSEPLAQHRVEGRAAAYYARGEVKEIAARSELIDFLVGDGRRWAAFPMEDLADIDVSFRKRTQRHLFIASEPSARVALAASTPVTGATNHNPLARFVMNTAPKVQYPVDGRFEDRVELVGYNLILPGKDHVGAGQTFTVEWVWRVLKANLGTYKVFVHLDGPEQRLNGDHEPVDGRYPVRLWDLGDVIVDRQELSVPATYPSGVYTLYVGFYRGESRLKVAQGPKDEANRLRAGTVRIR